MPIEPFSLRVPDEDLDDLRDRLARTRLLPDSPRRPASGMTNRYLSALLGSWLGLDWRAREDWLNSHPQFLADVAGDTVHCAHLRSRDPDAPALLVMHGWPHTFALQLDFADLLEDFHVVLPSLPGFAFSPPYADGAFTERALARTMNTLMVDVLGYDRYITYGEDVSANVSDLIAASFPQHVIGIVATHAHFPTGLERTQLEDPAEKAFFAKLEAAGGLEGGYAHAQATRPDTLAVGLNDSPAGLLAWIGEKLVEWSDTDRADPFALERLISRERILTEAMIYWVTQSIGTSFRPYSARDSDSDVIPPVEVPAAVAIQRHEGDYPESVARRFYRDLRSFDRLGEGGHFAVAEAPAEMAGRMRAFAADLGLVRV